MAEKNDPRKDDEPESQASAEKKNDASSKTPDESVTNDQTNSASDADETAKPGDSTGKKASGKESPEKKDEVSVKATDGMTTKDQTNSVSDTDTTAKPKESNAKKAPVKKDDTAASQGNGSEKKKLSIKRTFWPAYILHAFVFAAILCGAYFLFRDKTRIPMILAGSVGAYYALMIFLHRAVPSEHRSGLQYLRQRKFDKALDAFERSAKFFENFAWLDKYRYILLLTASAMSFRERALCNIAHCHMLKGDKKKSEAAYRFTLKEYPNCTLAKLSLHLLKKGITLPG